MTFIPNADQTSYADLAEPDSVDFDTLVQAHSNTYVQSGCSASVTGSNLTVTINSGTVVITGVSTAVSSSTVAIATAATATQARIALIIVDATGIPTVLNNVANSGSTNPELPTFTNAQVPLYAVYMPATAATVTNGQLVDKRVLKPAHDQVAHTGDVLPNNSDQVMGNGSLTMSRRLTTTVTAPAGIADRVLYNQHYTSKTGTGLTATALPRITVKNNANTDIPLESPAYGIADYIIYKDSTNCYAKNMRTQTIDFVGTSLHAVHNAAASATVNGVSGVADGTAADLTRGCVIYLATPDTALEEYTTDQSLVMQMGETLAGPGPGFKIRPSSTFPSGGGPTAANAIIDAYTNEAATPARIIGRVNITGLTIDGKTPGDAAQPSNLIGILQRRPDNTVSPAGGDFSKSTIWNNEVYNSDGGGIWIGLSTDPGANHATANAWMYANNVHDTTGNAKNIAIYVGDCHVGEGHQSQSNLGIPLYISASSVHVVGESHYGLQGSSNTFAPVWIASGNNSRVVGAYLDNIVSPNIPGIYSAGGRLKVQNCWFNGGQIGTDLSIVGVRLDGAQECMIQGNHGAANNAYKQQQIAVDATGGTFTLTYSGQTTAAQSFNVSASALQTALQGLSTIGSGNVIVTGGPGNAGATTPYVASFADQNATLMTANSASLTGGAHTATVTSITVVRNWKSIVDFVGGPSVNIAAKVEDNSFLFCKNVYTGTAPTYFHNKGNKVTYDASNLQANYQSYFSDNEGTATFAGTTLVITHQLDRTPVGVLLSPQGITSGHVSYGTLTATAFTATATTTNTNNVSWRAWT